MNRYDHIPDRDYIFAMLLITANRLDTLLDRTLRKFGITSKQWFLLLVVMNSFDSPPTLKEVARELGTSHQNVKQIALKLEEKGLVSLEKDSQDQRVTRIVIGEGSYAFWQAIAPEGLRFMAASFAGMNDGSMKGAREFLTRIMENLNIMAKESAE